MTEIVYMFYFSYYIFIFFFFSSRRRHTRLQGDWSSDVCSSDLEVFVIGDGVPDVTRELMAELAAADQRVRFFDHPKGPRHGERYRHAALHEARGEIVCYLCDDDLWLPGHVEHLRELLHESDFAHSLPFWIDPDGVVHPLRVDLSLPHFRALF